MTAERGQGAFLNGRRLQVSQAETLIDSLLVTGFPYDMHAQNSDLVDLPVPCQTLRQRWPAARTPGMAGVGAFANAGGGAVLHDERVAVRITAGLDAGRADRVNRLLLCHHRDGRGDEYGGYKKHALKSHAFSPEGRRNPRRVDADVGARTRDRW